MNVTGVISICYRRDYSIKTFPSRLSSISRKKCPHGEETISKRDTGRNEMRTIVITILALIIGFAIGIKLSEVIGIVGVLGFGRAVGIK
jgi:hypothetical protein